MLTNANLIRRFSSALVLLAAAFSLVEVYLSHLPTMAVAFAIGSATFITCALYQTCRAIYPRHGIWPYLAAMVVAETLLLGSTYVVQGIKLGFQNGMVVMILCAKATVFYGNEPSTLTGVSQKN